MKKRIILFILLIGFIFSFTSITAQEKYKVTIHVFNSLTCPHCAAEEEFLDSLLKEYDNLEVKYYPIDTDDAQKRAYNKLLCEKMAAIFEADVSGYPFTIIGGKSFVGFGDNSKTDLKIKKYVEKYTTNYHDDLVLKYLTNKPVTKDDLDYESDEDIMNQMHLPIIGDFNVKDVSLLLVSIVMGFIDGVNPCAMWILIFLITLLIPTNNKKKIWILGGTFLLTSGLFYFLLMMSWISVIKLISAKTVFLIIVGIFALLAGGYNVYKYVKSVVKKDDGCDVTDVNQKRKLMKKMKEVISKESLWLSIVGIMGIAIIVNLIELACSAGMPVLFSDVMAINEVSFWGSFFYTLVYILFFLIDDFIVFFIAAFTLKIKGVSNKLTKYSHLIGGIIMLALGILMLFFPNVLTLNF